MRQVSLEASDLAAESASRRERKIFKCEREKQSFQLACVKNAHRLRMSKQSGEVFRALSNLRWGSGVRRRHSQVDGWPTSLELSVRQEGARERGRARHS